MMRLVRAGVASAVDTAIVEVAYTARRIAMCADEERTRHRPVRIVPSSIRENGWTTQDANSANGVVVRSLREFLSKDELDMGGVVRPAGLAARRMQERLAPLSVPQGSEICLSRRTALSRIQTRCSHLLWSEHAKPPPA